MPSFTRTIENFECKNCHTFVEGNGYTNHCPQCLYSLHIDNQPGDRQNLCQGLMQPIDIVTQGGSPVDIIHQCQKCLIIKQNKISDNDSTETIISIMKAKVAREMMR